MTLSKKELEDLAECCGRECRAVRSVSIPAS